MYNQGVVNSVPVSTYMEREHFQSWQGFLDDMLQSCSSDLATVNQRQLRDLWVGRKRVASQLVTIHQCETLQGGQLWEGEGILAPWIYTSRSARGCQVDCCPKLESSHDLQSKHVSAMSV